MSDPFSAGGAHRIALRCDSVMDMEAYAVD